MLMHNLIMENRVFFINEKNNSVLQTIIDNENYFFFFFNCHVQWWTIKTKSTIPVHFCVSTID